MDGSFSPKFLTYLHIPEFLIAGIFRIVSQMLVIDRSGNFGRFSLSQRSWSGTQIFPLSVKLRHELSVTDLRFFRSACAEAALFLALANQRTQVVRNAPS